MRIGLLCLAAFMLSVPAVTQDIFHEAKNGNEEKVRELLGSDPALVSAVNDDHRTPLHLSAERGHTEVMTLLLGAGADINARDKNEETPLHRAAWRDQLDAGRLLSSKGADLEAKNNYGRTPLVIVGRESGSAAMARILLEAGADVNAQDRSGASALALGAWRGFRELVNLLLDNGAELPRPDSQDSRLVTMSAADKGLDRLFILCADAGVDLSMRNEGGGSLLHSSSQGGSAAIVSRLIDTGFDPNERDTYGRTPLHYAAELGREEAAKILIDRGARIDARSTGGETAYHTALAVGRQEMAAFLASAGADTSGRRFPELRGAYMGQPAPGPDERALMFATDIVSNHRFQHGTVVFSPRGNEAFWSSQVAIQETGYSEGMILFSRIADGRWSQPAPAPFSTLGAGDDVPFFSQDGNRLYFLSGRTAPNESEDGGERIWYTERTAGGWSEPAMIDGGPNTIDLHWQFSVAGDGSIFVGSRGDLFVSRLEGGRYASPENLGTLVNSDAHETMPFISPDGSYLLFTRVRHPENIGFADLWISFPDENGEWMTPLNMGKDINELAGICPIVSHDGTYLFFNSGNDDNYWVDAGIIEHLRAQHEARDSERK